MTRRTPLLAQYTVALLCALPALATLAQTTVSDPWVRGTVAQQTATGMFAKIVSAKGGRLLSASTAQAGVVEIHEMRMDGDQMRMRALPDGLALPAGQTVELRPGGHHLMLMDLKAPLKAGDTIELTLVVQGQDGQKENVVVKAPVRALGAAPMKMHEHKH